MSGGRASRLFWLILIIGFSVTLFRNVEPLKTINEMYSTPRVLLMIVFFISSAVWSVIAFRQGRTIAKEKA